MENYKIRSDKLTEMIIALETLVVPDAYDGLSARLIEKAGFDAVQCSGYSIALSKQISDEKHLSLEKNLQVSSEIVDAVSVPVMADGENGYGDGGQFSETIRRFIDIGCAGINIEDQSFNKDSVDKIFENTSEYLL